MSWLAPLSLIMLLLASSACRKPREEEEVVARVGRAVISQSEFQRKLQEVAPGYQSYVATPHGRRQFLDVLIREKLMLEAAKADGVAESPDFREQMAELRREEEAKLREAHDYLLSKLWVERLREKRLVSADDEEARDYLRRNPAQVSARHILVATADEAESVLARVRGGGAFAETAKKVSLDGETASEGGRMRPALLGETLPELDVLFKMRVGEVGGPVRSKFGYHILHKDGEDRPAFESVRGRVLEIVEKQKLDRHLQLVQASIRVEVVDEQFK
jgi:parvulin-like peptidyl-prolyl isomerase